MIRPARLAEASTAAGSVTHPGTGRMGDGPEVGPDVGSLLETATDLVIAKLLSFQHHHCDFARALPMVRALREQVDWPQVRRRISSSPFAEAFLLLADRLGLTGCPPGLDRTEAVPVSAEDSVYTEGRIQRHLAENPDTAELGVRAALHAGAVYLSGDVASEQRRRRVVGAVRALLPDLQVHDELQVTCADPPTDREELR